MVVFIYRVPKGFDVHKKNRLFTHAGRHTDTRCKKCQNISVLSVCILIEDPHISH